jgi:hypothetical protein
VKVFAIPIVGLVVALLAFPIVFATGDAPLSPCEPGGGSVDAVLLTIRTLESGGDYTIEASGSTASGAYQFLDSSWAGYGGYQRAADAPPAVQDAKAIELVGSILERYAGDVAAIPVVWYIGHVPADDSPSWDTVPAPHAGNRLTPRQYQSRWLDKYAELTANTATSNTAPTETSSCRPGVAIDPVADGWSIPGPVEVFAVAPVGSPHHDYPAWDWMLPVGTPIYAVRGGTVTTVQYWPHNWWDAGCGTIGEGCVSCGIGVTITDVDGNRWAYCHGSAIHVSAGQEVAAGTQLLSSGNTGRSGGPHLHLQIRTADGVLRCIQPLLRSLRDSQTGVDLYTLPTAGCFV